jgi:hypothetical protein
MTAVRGAVTDVLVQHQAEARIEVTIRIQPTVQLHHRTVMVDVATAAEVESDEEVDDRESDVDQLKAYQDARFAALEL